VERLETDYLVVGAGATAMASPNAPLMDKPKVRDKVVGLIKAGLQSANQKPDALLNGDQS
jgi:hypothetical protein